MSIDSAVMQGRGLRVAEVECIRGERILFSRLSFAVHPGELLHVEGANGSGKTSLLRILSSLSPPASGQVFWNGQPISKIRPAFLAQMAYLGHQAGIKAELTALENLTMVQNLYATRSDRDVKAILAQSGLAAFEEVPARSLSAGQRQRIALARLLLLDARLWILDEPFTSLDSSGCVWLQSLLDQHLQQEGLVILTAHHALNLQIPIRRLSLTRH